MLKSLGIGLSKMGIRLVAIHDHNLGNSNMACRGNNLLYDRYYIREMTRNFKMPNVDLVDHTHVVFTIYAS